MDSHSYLGRSPFIYFLEISCDKLNLKDAFGFVFLFFFILVGLGSTSKASSGQVPTLAVSCALRETPRVKDKAVSVTLKPLLYGSSTEMRESYPPPKFLSWRMTCQEPGEPGLSVNTASGLAPVTQGLAAAEAGDS